MKRIFILAAAVLLAGIAGILAGCSAKPNEDGYVSRAMYVPFGKSSYVMVQQDQNYQNVFTVTMPEEIYGLSGEKITADQLQKGNILEITGDGVMLESYPGQYPGVTKIRVVEQGAPADADQYQNIIDEIYTEPDPSQPPTLQIENLSGQTASCALATMGGYNWNWIVNEATGEGQSAIACGAHILEWNDINGITMEKTDRLNLLFSQEPTSVQAERWPEDQRGSAEAAASEQVEVQREDGGWFIDAEVGYIYAVYGKWNNGHVEYGFVTMKR